MIDGLVSLLQTSISDINSIIASNKSSSDNASTTVSSLFDADYLMDAIGSQQSVLAAAYDSTGASLLPPSSSTAGQERAALLEEAGNLFTDGDYAGARAKAETVMKKYSGDATPVYLIGRSYLMEGDYKQAETYLSRAAALASDSTEIQYDLAAAQTLSRGEDAVTEELQRLLRNRATASQGLQLGSYILRAWPENLATRLAVADYYTDIGRVDYTGAVYAQALKQVPANQQGPLLKRVEKLASAYDDDPAAHDLLAQAYANAGRLSDAERQFQRAMDLSEGDMIFQSALKADFADVYTRMARTALTNGKETEAQNYLQKALKLNWSDERKLELADLEVRLGEKALQRGLFGDALREFGKAASYMPSEGEDDRRDRLIKDYERLAAKLTSAGDLRRAVSARQGAYNLDTDDDTRMRRLADAHDVYGLWLFDRQRYREAVRSFKAALKLYPDDETYTTHLNDAKAA